MDTKNKYYYINDVNFTFSSNQRQPQLIKWNESYYVSVDEEVEFNQSISVIVDKLHINKIEKPKNTKYEKVKPVLKELFTDYYYFALRNISAAEINDGEYYIIKKSKDWYQVEYYSRDEKNRLSLIIDFRDSIEDLWLMVNNTHGHKGRPNARKNGLPITFEEFKQFLNLTLKFLSDHDSYKVYLERYLKNFYNLAAGNNNLIEGFDISSERAFKNILEQLNKRKSTIEKRLIKEDNDSLEDRIKLRGEIEGIKYAIKTINIHK